MVKRKRTTKKIAQLAAKYFQEYSATYSEMGALKCWEAIKAQGIFCCMDVRWPICEGWEVTLTPLTYGDKTKKHCPVIVVGGGPSKWSFAETVTRAAVEAQEWINARKKETEKKTKTPKAIRDALTERKVAKVKTRTRSKRK